MAPKTASFSPFHNAMTSNMTINWKSVDGVFGIRTLGRRMNRYKESTELWQPPDVLFSLSLQSRNLLGQLGEIFPLWRNSKFLATFVGLLRIWLFLKPSFANFVCPNFLQWRSQVCFDQNLVKQRSLLGRVNKEAVTLTREKWEVICREGPTQPKSNAQCDQMGGLFVQYLAICNNEYLPKGRQYFP